ncbi:hypothetical protein NEUTE1DRAFT_120634 [Neurospora tetrasperma FGSC 2508]|uniref:Major facilitator superfamily (MFS) profile domain-containing protein n=1 Tax=Neurospora tetrasperma (strain FGSC 2508 / ATCC MYA-4615 / P0657) TaxID=510951 RepID=F8MGC3_NEUT8|nr:uncharacterized protein NEUTE1DRAFT_120634 [Neurospora tetrasperma FGSC 2508]EGO58598.1 hypothetical protein NEUTE1DRAFT_120634 [Neurospora tetrasperma FGSC 2508]
MAKPPPPGHPTPGSTGFTTRLRSYFHSSGPSSNPLERRLLLKIDFFILTFCCLSYFLNYLDRTALSNAYVSGMKESLSFHGNQLNQINTCFTIGYVLGQIPSNLSLHYIAPRIFFPGMMVLWAGLTMVTAAARHPGDILAIRFFQGVAESTTFVGTHYILGSWYTEQELGKRSGVFTASGLAGTMIGGFVQSGIHGSLDGLRGLSGWRWLFIIDGIITLPVAIYGFCLFPDTPKTTRAPYLSVEERELAIRRMEKQGVPAVGILSTLFFAFITDLYPHHRSMVGYFIGIIGVLTPSLILAAEHGHFGDPAGSKATAVVMGMYYLSGSVYACQATFFAWANDAMTRDGKEAVFRGVVLAGMNMGNNAVNAWWSIVFYGADMAPWFERGMWAMIGMSVALAIWTGFLSFVGEQMSRLNGTDTKAKVWTAR